MWKKSSIATLLLLAAASMVAMQVNPRRSDEQLQSTAWWLARAREEALLVQEEEPRRKLLWWILSSQVEAGAMDDAAQTRHNIEQLAAQPPGISYYRQLTELYGRTGQLEAAQETAEAAWTMATESDQAEDQPAMVQRRMAESVFVELARHQAQHGQIAQAKATALRIESLDQQQRAMEAIGYAQAKEDLLAALETFKAAPVAGRIGVIGLAGDAVERQRWDIFDAIVHTSLEQAQQAPPRWRAVAYRDIGRALEEAESEADPALIDTVRGEIVRFMEQNTDLQAATEATRGLLHLGQLEEARQAITGLEDHFRSALSAELARQLARKGRYAEAREAAGKATLHRGHHGLALSLAADGKMEEAKRAAKEVRNSRDRNDLYRSIALAEAAQGEVKQAKQTLEQITDRGRDTSPPAEKARRLVGAARHQLRAGGVGVEQTLSQARAVARQIPNEVMRRMQLEEIGRFYIEIGEPEQARQIALEAGTTRLLIQLAEQELERGEMQSFERSMRQAMEVAEASQGRGLEGLPGYLEIGALYLRADRRADAEQAARRLVSYATDVLKEVSMHKILVYAAAAALYARLGELERHSQTIQQLPTSIDRSAAYAGVALSLLRQDDWDKSFRANRNE